MDLDTRSMLEARRVVRRALRYPLLRGTARQDGRLSLLTVNYRCERDVERLVRSWRRFVSPDWPVIVVDNSNLPFRWKVPTARVVGVGRNLTHGLGLQLGMRFVSTEYSLICDPDSIVVGDLWGELEPRLRLRGIAGIDLSAPYFHPFCVAFRTQVWKQTRLSLEEDWSRGFDVGRSLTPTFGGLHPDALIPRTRSAGSPIISWPTGGCHFVAEVYGDVMSNTLGGSRVYDGPGAFGKEEGSLDQITKLQDLWRAWADRYLSGVATLSDFPK